MPKFYIEKGESKHSSEFPEEQARNPLDEEAAVFVNSLLTSKGIDGTLTENIGKESYYGMVEYKLKLMEEIKHKKSSKLNHLTTQLNFRLNEGNGRAKYRIGVEDNGNPIGITDEHLIGSLSKYMK